MPAFQGSLFDAVDSAPTVSWEGLTDRTLLSQGAWVDLHRSWLSGGGPLLARLLTKVPWQAERRQMYDRMVDVPRLTHFYADDDALPDPVLESARAKLNERYGDMDGGPLCSAGICLYRDGNDSVAWHGDRIGRAMTDDTVVAIISLGAYRRFSLRPRGGGSGVRFTVGGGDLLVMGGSCQRTWEHAVAKTSKAVGPRISIQFRQSGVR